MHSINTITLPHLALAFVPVLFVLIILWHWGIMCKSYLYGLLRMLSQLLLIGYVLVFIFKSENALIIVGVLSVMLLSSSWIALRSVNLSRKILYPKALLAISITGVLILWLITQGVLQVSPWYLPSVFIPLAGMIFATAMNSISLSVERLEAEINRGVAYEKARLIAIKASLIPIVNSLFAVGLVSLPGMMTGQILSGVSPFIAARYQIMVMCMVFASSGLSALIFLTLVKCHFKLQK